jgi:hypothetical protein
MGINLGCRHRTFRGAAQVQVPGVIYQVDIMRAMIIDALETDTLALRSHVDFCESPCGLFLRAIKCHI